MMRKQLLCSLLVAAMGLFPSLLFCQPKVTLPGGTEFDFGEVYTGAIVKKKVTIQNTGDDTLFVHNVSTSCGCTATMLSKSSIPAGDSGSLEISFNSKKFSGKVEKAVTFETNDSTQKKVRIIFYADVNQILEFDPDHLVFNVVKTDSDNVRQINLTNVGRSRITIKSITSNPDDIKVEPSLSILEPGFKSVLKCTINPKSEGMLKGDIVITTDHPLIPNFTIHYYALAKKAIPPMMKN